MSTVPKRMLSWVAVILFIVYCAWNIYWLAQGQFAPALFKAVTGLPAPTTGGTRALARLWEGDVQESLRFNCMAVPLMLLLVASLVIVVCQLILGGRPRLPEWIWWLWVGLLALAWLTKLTGDPAYW